MYFLGYSDTALLGSGLTWPTGSLSRGTVAVTLYENQPQPEFPNHQAWMWQHWLGVVDWLILSDVLITSKSNRSLSGLYDMTIRERQKGELMTLWLVEYLKGAYRSKVGITGFPGIRFTADKEMVRCPVNHPPVSCFWCTLLLPLVLCEPECVSGLHKILQCSFQDQ